MYTTLYSIPHTAYSIYYMLISPPLWKHSKDKVSSTNGGTLGSPVPSNSIQDQRGNGDHR